MIWLKKNYNHVEIEMLHVTSEDILVLSNENETDIVLPEIPGLPGGPGSGSGGGAGGNETERA